MKSTVDAIPELISDKAVKLFEDTSIFCRKELESRFEIYLENYSMQLNIEAGMMVEIANRQITPAVSAYISQIADSASKQKQAGLSITGQEKLISELSQNLECLIAKAEELSSAMEKALEIQGSAFEQGRMYRDSIVPIMEELRICGDNLEQITDRSLWPLPSYEDLLFRL